MVQDKTLDEKTFQDNTVRALTGKFDNVKSWTAPDYLDGTKQKVTYQTLLDNWRTILNRQNASELEGHDLTDQEFKQVMSKVNGIENSYGAAKILAAENATGKIDGILRDSELPDVTRSSITLRIFEKAKVNGGDTVYQIAREVWTENDRNRFDILLLVNGLPLINIEQKRVDKNADEAFGQFKRYYQAGEFTNNFFAFSQMMVIMTDIDTRYFATPKSLEAFNPAFQFHWADKSNRPINTMTEITKTLLRIPMAHQMVGDYLIINEDTRNPKNQFHMLMRPYQVEALRAVEMAANGRDNEQRMPHGGFVWHTTGSGKTITSFKVALALSKTFDKVIFLLDRKDLDTQTTKNFKAYSQYETIEVSDSPNTNDLMTSLRSSVKGVVVATTFKLNNVIKSLNENGDSKGILNKRMAIIIDEAHRTTMGGMMMNIKESLNHTLFYGFTGTPLFDESNAKGIINEQSQLLRTTEQMFGKELHRYTIDEAIKDRNVLGFHVDYINTGEFSTYESLKEPWIELQKAKPSNKYTDGELESKAMELENNRSTDSEGIVNGRAQLEDVISYSDDKHIPRVVEQIIKDWKKQSKGILGDKTDIPYKFNAMLTVAYKPRVMAYYDEFKKQLAEQDGIQLNVMATFSEDNENTEGGQEDKAYLTRLYNDWHEMGHPMYQVEASKPEQGESGFFSDITAVFKNGGHATNARNIDLMIVADRLLTGYDSKLMNTLYVDRKLILQGLIQAYSRTNRIYGRDKEFGTIINFQYPAKTRYSLEKALKLYGSGGTSSLAVVDEYEVAVSHLIPLYDGMNDILPNPENWRDIEHDEDATDDFLKSYGAVGKHLRILQQYYEFDWAGQGSKQLALGEEEWMKYSGAARNLRPKTEVEDEPGAELVGGTKLADQQDVTFGEIISLIGKMVDANNSAAHESNAENERLITEAIAELRTYGDKDNAALLEQFLDEVIKEHKLDDNLSVEANYRKYVAKLGEAELDKYAERWGVAADVLLTVYNNYHIGDANIDYFDELRQSSNYKESEWYQNSDNQAGGLPALRYKNALQEDIQHYLIATKNVYGDFI